MDQHSAPHHEGGHTTTQNDRPCGGPHLSTARPNMGGATHRHCTPHSRRGARTNTAHPSIGGSMHQHSEPHQEGGHAPAQHQPRPSKQHNPNRDRTADHSHSNMPTVRRRRRCRTNKTSCAWLRLKHHQPEHNDAGRLSAQTTTQSQHHHTTHNHRGGQVPTQHTPP